MDRHISGLSKFFLYGLFGYFVYRQSDERILKSLTIFVLVLAVIESSVLLISKVMGNMPRGQLSGHLGYSAMLIGAGICLVPAVLSHSETRKSIIGGIFLVSFLLIGLLITKSRGGFLAVGVALLVFLKEPKVRWIPASYILFSVIILLFNPEAATRFMKFDLGNLGEYSGRFVIWKTAAAAILDRWLFGFGMGNFESAYLLHQFPENQVFQYAKTTIFAHNDFLQIAVAVGIPGLVFLGWFAVKNFQLTSRWPFFSFYEKWAFATLILFIVNACFNFTVYLPLIGLVLSLAIGILLHHKLNPRELSKKHHYALVPVGSILILFVFLSAGASGFEKYRHRPDLALRILPAQADLWYETAMSLITDQDFNTNKDKQADALRRLQTSLSWNPDNAFVWSRTARVINQIEPNSTDIIERTFQQAIQLAPFHAPFHLEAGFYAFNTRQLSKAESFFERAIDLEPNAPLPYFSKALISLQKGENDKALALLKTAEHCRKKYHHLSNRSEYIRFLMAVEPSQVEALRKKITADDPGRLP